MIKFNLIITTIFTSAFLSCSSSNKTASNVADLRVEIKAVEGNNNVVRTRDGQIIGKINNKDEVIDLKGNKIGRVTYSSNEEPLENSD
jgi:uncharacterized protein YjdB